MNEFGLDGIVVIVTGGSSGIGEATALRMTGLGARVYAVDRAPTGTSAFAEIDADVTDQKSVDAAIDQVVESEGRVDVVINNAGIGSIGTVVDNCDDEWRAVFDVNVMGIVRTMRAALPYLRKSPNAAVVNLCSVAATTGLPERAAYSASKGAVLSLTLAMAADHIREGIRVNCVNPGTVDTPWVQRLLTAASDPADERRALDARQPIGRLVSAAEVAQAITYLASPLSGSSVGSVLEVDGGMRSLRLRYS